ncbi:FUSC family protein [Chitinolyticbacter meiyuanensis]|uniref:FUSC family protein n=1 Tax=Chitinolyticbacter meiyuanensis TaxID=682798 RepID=UPI0016521962|nr:FUSC family protein [Chitinolyticbacter meiyuanensis]
MALPLHLLTPRNAPLPWRKAFCALLAVAVPAIAALAIGQPWGVLFGAIGGLYASFLDFGGTLRHRLLTQAAGLALIVGAAVLGHLVGANSPWLFPLFAALALGTSWADGSGVALESIFRFALLAFLLYAFVPAPPAEALAFAAVGIAVGLVAVGVDSLFWPRALPRQHPGLANSVRQIARGETAGWRHAVGYAATCCFALWLALDLHSARPAWVAAATLFAIRPDGPDSLRRLFQTAFGTLVGVAGAWLLAHLTPHPLMLLIGVLALAFYRPLAMVHNVWLHSATLTAFILLLFEIALLPAGGTAGAAILRERLNDVMLGSLVALVGVALFNSAARRHLLARLGGR